MTSTTIEKYRKLLGKEPQVGDKYVIIDKKWLDQWKRYVGIEKSDEENPITPGTIDFTKLADSTIINELNDVQLRSDAVEGNDYTFIPYELYKELVDTHGKIGTEIIRMAISQGSYDVVIETFLVPLRICASKASSRSKQIYRSRRTKIEDLKKEICNEYRIPPTSTYRLYSSKDDRGFEWELLEDQPDLTLEEAALTKNAYVTYDLAPSSALTGYSNSSYSTSRGGYTPGLCGLSNLGNTCFMNSAIQCISNVPTLTEYFLRDEYKDHINSDNPLGMKGDVAKAYGELIHEMWSGKTNYCAPRSLKQNVARYAPQFSGFAQQDSQEFMSFLLDGLHEDLNLIKKKPYVEKKDDDGKLTDVELAKEQWGYYMKRNQSKIHDIFHGQIKSIVTCLTCGTQARTFDPICFLSLPLPGKAKIRTFKIDYVRLNGKIKTYNIKCDENGRVRNLLQQFCDRFQPKVKTITKKEPMDTDSASNSHEINPDEDDEEQDDEEDFTKDPDYDGHQPKSDFILPVEVYNHRIHLQYADNTLLTSILERDHVVFYEVSDSLKKADNEKILMPCTFRDDYYHQNFGLPIYLSVPRRQCKGKDIQDALQEAIGHFIPLQENESSDKSLYTPLLVFSQSYSPTTKPLKNYLDDHIDFGHKSTSLIVDVASSIADKYKKLDDEKFSQNNRTSPIGSGVQTRSQQKKTTTLTDCFKYFTKKEVLSDDDLWKCPNCKELKKATKKMDLWLLPKVLIVQLKRFNYTRYYRDKIDLYIDCPLRDLDLTPFVLNPAEKSRAKYELIAVSNHMGGLGGGHYTANAKNSSDEKWHNFDDSYVSNISENDVITKAAYVLVYQQQSK